MPRNRSALLLLLVLAFAGLSCATNEVPPGLAGSVGGAVESGNGTILFRSVLQRTVPGDVDRMQFVAYDAEGGITYGPTVRERAAEIPLYDVPTETAALLTVYLNGDVVRGLDANPILLPPGGTVIVEGTFRNLEAFVTLEVEPKDLSVATGTRVPYTAMATLLGTRSYDVTELVRWTSSTPGVALMSDAGVATTRTPGATTVTARYGTLTASTSLTVTGALLTRLEIEPVDATLPQGAVQAYRAIGFFDDGSSEDLTQQVAWAVDDPAVATFGQAAPELTAVAAGVTTVRATDPESGAQASTSVTVESPAVTLDSIVVTPLRASVPVGQALNMSATGVYSDGSVVDLTRAARWTSSDPLVAGVGRSGLARGLAQGATRITATYAGVQGDRLLQVTAAVLTSVEVHPARVELPAGTGRPFRATGRYSDGTARDLTEEASWSSDAPAVAWVADAPGRKGIVTAESVGQATIRATEPDSGLSGTGIAVVTPAALVRLEVTPNPTRVLVGRERAFTATGVYTDDTTQDLTLRVTWGTSDPGIARIDSRGICVGVSPGTAAVSATESGLTAQARVEVLARPEVRLEVSPPQASLPAGTEQPYTATLIVGDNFRFDVTDQAAWESSDVSVAEVAPDGVARGMAPGSCQVRALLKDSGLQGTAELQVTPAVMTALEVDPPLAVVQEGGTVQFRAIGRFSDDTVRDVTEETLWTSLDPAILEISNAVGSQGLGTGLAPGTTRITAQVDGFAAGADVQVDPAPVTALEVLPDGPTLTVGNRLQFGAVGTTANGRLNLTDDVLWESSDPTVLTVSNAPGSKGLGTAVGVGASTVTATDPATGVSDTSLVTVTPALPVSLHVFPAALTLPTGTGDQLEARATYADGTEVDVTAESVWASSNPQAVSVSNAAGQEGAIRGVAEGTGTVTATLEGTTLSADSVVTVVPPTALRLEILAATASLVKNDLLPMIAILHFDNGTQADVTGDVLWETSDPGVVGVINDGTYKGVATAVNRGAATVTAHLPETTFSDTWNLAVDNGKSDHGGIAILPRVVNANPGSPSVPLTAYAIAQPLEEGEAVDVTTRSRWFSGNELVFTVDGKGWLTFLAPGESEVTSEWSSVRILGIARIVVLP